MKILITGATGYIGTYLLHYLSRTSSIDVTALDIRPSVVPLPKNVKYSSKNFHSLKQKDLKGYDAVIHLAGVSGHSEANADWKKAVRDNVWGTLSLANFAKEVGVKKFLFPSTSSVYQGVLGDEKPFDETAEVKPLDVYSFTKLEAEYRLADINDEDFKVIIPRFGSVYGFSPRMRWDILVNIFTYHALKNKVITVHDAGKAWRPVTFIGDVSRFYEWGLTSDKSRGIYNINDGNYTILEVAKLLQKNLGRHTVKIELRPLGNAKEVMSYKMDPSKSESHGFSSKFKLPEVIKGELKKFKKLRELK